VLLAVAYIASQSGPAPKAEAAVGDFHVFVNFHDDDPSVSLTIYANCDLTLNNNYESGEEGNTYFSIDNYTHPEWGDTLTVTTCTAYIYSGLPSGYTANDSDCISFNVEYDEGDSCTIDVYINTATLTVYKDWAEGPDDEVTVNVACDDVFVQVDQNNVSFNESDGGFQFGLLFIPESGTTCYATDSLTEGAAENTDPSDSCSTGVSINDDSSESCTIYNVWNRATFRVTVGFEPGAAGPSFDLSLDCASKRVIDDDTLGASSDGDIDFLIYGIPDAGTICSVTHTPPTGYATTADTCSGQNTAANDEDSTTAGSCAITVTTSTTITVQKNYEPDNIDNPAVTITLSCSGATIDDDEKTASEGSPAVFTVSNFATGATCSASESGAPAGWSEVANGCTTGILTLIAGAVDPAPCVITNAPLPDADGDGITDPDDACSGTVAGVLVMPNGCSVNQATPVQCASIKFAKVIIGTDEANTILGTSGNDLIFGLGGADTISGGGGHDCIVGGDGADVITGGAGNDLVFGGEGGDSIDGGTGNDVLRGEAGGDTILGGIDNDRLYGGEDNDNLNGGNGNDQLNGEAGVDSLIGGLGTDGCTPLDAGGTRALCEAAFTGP